MSICMKQQNRSPDGSRNKGEGNVWEIPFISLALFCAFKGLVAVGERAQKRSGNFSAAMKDLSGEGGAGDSLSPPHCQLITGCHTWCR